MTASSRKAARIVMLLFIAWGVIASATRFAASADAQAATLGPHFSGRVTGPDGKPVRGARVFVVADDGFDRALEVRAETDVDGRFAFDAKDMDYTGFDGRPALRDCIVSATADGFGPDWIASGRPSRFKQADLALQLAADVPIRGRFLGPDGRPLAGARVRLTALAVPLDRDLDAHLEREKTITLEASAGYENRIAFSSLSSRIPVNTETRTDASGRFQLSGLGRDRIVNLTVSAPSVVDTFLTVMTRDAPDVPIQLGDGLPNVPMQVIHGAGFALRLKPGRTISGVVRDRDTREPIAGMWVGIGSENTFPRRTKDEIYPRDGVLFNRTVSDAKGRFSITGLDPGIAKRPITAMSAPGLPYLSAGVFVEGDAPALIECRRGIPFRLKLVDEQGRPALAKVTYNDVSPNPHAPRGSCDPCNTPLSRAARKADGMYHGFVVPGPGAVFVETPGRSDYRPAQVDPKAFFAPGRTEWTAQEWISSYGTKDFLSTSGGGAIQSDYAAIVLVNPAPASGPLKLSATVVKGRSRRVSLVDPDGKPVVGAQTQIAQGLLQPQRMTLRSSSLLLTGLHPDRVRRITFLREDRQLIGFLLAQGDGAEPSTVRMAPWATVTGRIVDENGEALPIRRPLVDGKWPPILSLHLPGNFRGLSDASVSADAEGRFRISKLVPGQRYSGTIYQDQKNMFTDPGIDNLVFGPGEVLDLGDIRIKAAVDAKAEKKPGK